MKENAGLAHLDAGTLEGLVFLELVGASLEDPGEDGSVVHPARHGYEVGHEVEWECQIGESACAPESLLTAVFIMCAETVIPVPSSSGLSFRSSKRCQTSRKFPGHGCR